VVVAHAELDAEAEEGHCLGREADKFSRGAAEKLIER
jgi:hypothetical protein